MESTAIKQAPESSVSGLSSNRVISLSKVRIHQRAVKRYRNNMIKQRLSGLGLLLVCWSVWVMTKDLTVSILIAPLGFTMIFSKKYIMKFNVKE